MQDAMQDRGAQSLQLRYIWFRFAIHADQMNCIPTDEMPEKTTEKRITN